MNHWVMDYETLTNCFLGVFEHFKTDESKVFTVGLLRNDLPEFLDFLDYNRENNEWHVSYNGLAFDSQITQFILVNRRRLLTMSGEAAAHEIYKKAQDCIGRQNRRDFQEWSERKLWIKQIDVFKLNHWDNPAKRSSLKWIQVSMDWYNVQDMPIDHTMPITTVPQLQQVAKYCRNDVASCKKIMQLSSKQIALRGTLTKTYGVNLYSASEPRISKELFLYFLSRKTHISSYELKQMRTYRSEIRVKDILLPYIEFNDLPEVQDLLEKFKELVIYPGQTKGGFKYSVNYRGVKTDFGLGGLHGAKRGIYESDEEMTIVSSDVVSYYPNLAIRNGWAPAHLPRAAFCEQYEWFFEERKKIPKSDPRNYVYKIILNSTYGLSNDQYSFLYDPEFTMRITINGQLLLMLLYTMLAEGVPGAMPIMQNTDGVEMKIPKKYMDKYLSICKTWEEITDLKLEHDEYQKLIVPDVNNYIGVNKFKEVTKDKYEEMQKDAPEGLYKIEAGKYYNAPTKCKGRFEYKDLALHKNKSFQIIPKALFNYFVHGIKPEDYLLKNREIFDYCGGVKIRGNWKFMETSIINGELSKNELQKTIRYYISDKGSKIIKENKSDGRTINVVSGRWMQTVFNLYEDKPWDDYGINDQFYLERIYKEIKSMEPEKYNDQLSLFKN
jgi:hypothetical protein